MAPDPPRPLGLIEAFVAARDQCPNAAVQRIAREALEAVQREGARALAERAFLLLSAIQGWRGERAGAVRASLETFLKSLPREE